MDVSSIFELLRDLKKQTPPFIPFIVLQYEKRGRFE
jgi:hypothetical protein